MSIASVTSNNYLKQCGSFCSNLYEIGFIGILKDMKHVFTSSILPKKTIPGSNAYTIVENEGCIYSRINGSSRQEKLRDRLGDNDPADLPGCAYSASGKMADTCVQYAFEGYEHLHPSLKDYFKIIPKGTHADFDEILDLRRPSQHPFLADWNPVSPLDATPGDVICYTDWDSEFPLLHAVHVGIIDQVDQSVNPPRLTVRSKWGTEPAYLHNVDMLPRYGDRFVIMRSPYRVQFLNSLAEKIRSKYKTFVKGLTYLSIVGIAAAYFKWFAPQGISEESF